MLCDRAAPFVTYIIIPTSHPQGFPGGSDGKESASNAEDSGSVSSLRVSKIPWRKEWLPTPVFLPRKFHGQRSLTGYSPWGPKHN